LQKNVSEFQLWVWEFLMQLVVKANFGSSFVIWGVFWRFGDFFFFKCDQKQQMENIFVFGLYFKHNVVTQKFNFKFCLTWQLLKVTNLDRRTSSLE
jgi:hypothetical protein